MRLELALLCALSAPAFAAPIRFELMSVPGHHVTLAADFMEWEAISVPEETPGVYAIRLEEPWRPRVEYKFLVDGVWEPGANRIREAAAFKEDPWLTLRPDALPLKEETFDFEGRLITVLRADRPSVTAYFQDGPDYLEQGHVRELLANLAADSAMLPITAVFIPSSDRMKEYARSPTYADYLSSRLVPEIERRVPMTGGAPARRLVLGASMGGIISLYTSLRHPEVFALAASQSGSVWWEDGALLADLARAAGLKFFMDCGTYESPQMLDYNQRGARVARQAGAAVTYREYPSTHDWVSWRNRLQEILRGFFSTTPNRTSGKSNGV